MIPNDLSRKEYILLITNEYVFHYVITSYMQQLEIILIVGPYVL